MFTAEYFTTLLFTSPQPPAWLLLLPRRAQTATAEAQTACQPPSTTLMPACQTQR